MKLKLRTIVVGICAFATLAVAGFMHNDGAQVTADEKSNQGQPAVWMQMTPVSNRVSLAPGQEVEDKFTVENIGSADFKYKVYAAPYSVTNENYDLSFSAENNYTRIKTWITFRQADGEWSKEPTFTIPKGQKQDIQYRISVPQDVPAGGQYATLFAESIGDDAEGGTSTGVKTSSRVGLLLYANVAGDTRRAGSIEDYDFTRFLLGGTIKATTKVKNSGNTDFAVTDTFEVKTLFGKTVYPNEESQSATNALSVLPDTERRVNHEWKKEEGAPWIGIFQVHYKVSIPGEERDETAVVFVIPLVAIILLVLFLTILIIWTIIAIRTRKERKARHEK